MSLKYNYTDCRRYLPELEKVVELIAQKMGVPYQPLPSDQVPQYNLAISVSQLANQDNGATIWGVDSKDNGRFVPISTGKFRMRRVHDSGRGELGSYGWLLGPFRQLSKSNSKPPSPFQTPLIAYPLHSCCTSVCNGCISCLSMLAERMSGPLERRT